MQNPKEDAIAIYNAAVEAVLPSTLLGQYLAVTDNSIIIDGQHFPPGSFNNIYVIGAGKASAAMAVALETILGERITSALVVTKYHHALPTNRIRIIEAAHPVPDENGQLGVAETLRLLQEVEADDIVICLVSGGASSLWCDVPATISIPEMQLLSKQLLHCGASIHEINTLRKHLSIIKGGQLVKHCGGARIFSFIISDVPGNKISDIASGPTHPDPASFEEARSVLEKYQLVPVIPASITNYLTEGVAGRNPETPKPGDPLFENVVNRIIGDNQVALRAAATRARSLGYDVIAKPDLVTGIADIEGRAFARMAKNYQGKSPVCFLQGGETVVVVTGKGKGGRNQQFVLAAMDELGMLIPQYQSNQLTLLSGGTDGSDGPTDAAGAIIDEESLRIASALHLSIPDYLANNDAYHFFQKTQSLLRTGPTQTNVMDIMIAIIHPASTGN